MHFKIKRKIIFLYNKYIILKFEIRKFIFGFDYASKILLTCNKSVVIPILRKNGAKIGENCDIEVPLVFHNSIDFSNLEIGSNCHIGKNCFFDLRDKVIIGDNVVVSMQCVFITHIDMSKSKLSSLYPAASKEIIIENNCYLGTGTTVLMGIKIQANSFIAAGSMVNVNVCSNTMAGGIPIKKIKDLD